MSNPYPVQAPLPIILPWQGVEPEIDASAFVAPGATVIGDVVVGAESSVWFGCVVRGDVHEIRIGKGSNIQDGTVVHVTRNGHGTYIGDNVLIGHNCIIHACTLEDNAFIGMGATVMDGAVVEKNGMVAAGALLTPGKRVGSGELWGGSPAKFMRQLKPEEIERHKGQTAHYAKSAAEYRDIIAGL